MKTYFESNPKKLRFQKKKNVFREYVMDCGLISGKARVSLAKMTGEGVWLVLIVAIDDG